ncbi:hypothetical protein [Streptomyces heilongjiangensis]|uniref:Uncharacterized protein n=1 Tax=Streptomyces heilongjiangensis TaxID=945052 RepID=A0ABW1B5U8_9ACTN|nr:hypothetical protein [Streptomyces heilongjiangensis]MDC2951418.1 hypothetical protein [Streptomyces heilongjiangensis]
MRVTETAGGALTTTAGGALTTTAGGALTTTAGGALTTTAGRSWRTTPSAPSSSMYAPWFEVFRGGRDVRTRLWSWRDN